MARLIKKKIQFFLLFVSTTILPQEYLSNHDETYWFPNHEFLLEGSQVGTVRSNLVWSDRMSIIINEANCKTEPILFINLSTSKIPEIQIENPDFDFSSLEGKFLELGFNFDNKLIEKHDVLIASATELANGHHNLSLWFDEMPESFLMSTWQVLTMKILENDPYRDYFDKPERQYRMGGFPVVLVDLLGKCEEANNK